MELAFDSKSLRAVCEIEHEAERVFGATVTEVIKHRLADLSAAKSLEELPNVTTQMLRTDDHKVFITLCDGYAMILCANHPKIPTTPDGAVDWKRVGRLRLLEITHDVQ